MESQECLPTMQGITIGHLFMWDHVVDAELLTCDLERLFRNQPQLPGVLICDEGERVGMISRGAFAQAMALNFHRDIFRKRPVRDLYEHLGIRPLSLRSDCPIYRAVEKALGRPQHELHDPIVVVAESGEARLLEPHVLLLSQAQQLRDQVGRHEEMEVRLAHEARHDALTGLPNRAALRAQLEDALLRCRLDEGRHEFALMFLDFDRFKLINDSLGHLAGDDFLREVAGRLKEVAEEVSCRSQGVCCCSLARLGGDEFTVLVEGAWAIGAAVELAEQLQRILSAPYRLEGNEVSTSASIGIVSSALGHRTSEDLLRDADIAMYRAKEGGKACHVVFTQEMLAESHDALRLITDLRSAVGEGQLRLWYQPLVSLTDNTLAGFEALLRWEHPTRGMVSPGQMIPLAEDTGLIVPIGWWVIEAACRQLAEWVELRGGDAAVKVSVNLSKKQLFEPGFAERLMEMMERYGVERWRLNLEVTESTIISGGEKVQEVLRALYGAGVSLWMDDFGTGASSLSCLHQYPLAVLKLDAQFVRNMDCRADYSAITQAVVTLAHALKLRVVAEGIETSAQLASVLALEADVAQGYLFSPPVPAERATLMLEGGRALWQAEQRDFVAG